MGTRRAISSLLAIILLAVASPALAGPSLNKAIADVQPRLVKIYGAGGVRGLEAYQSGFLISDEGHVLTVWSYVLDTDYITVTLDDGRKFQGQLLGADPRLDLAVLKIDATGLPYLDPAAAVPAGDGTRVLAFSNLYGVAAGDEPLSVQHGTVSAVTTLDARRGAYETPYQGPVYVLDAMTNNPGAPGGALVNLKGELLGMLGKELRNSATNTWLNYAVPMNELMPAIDAIKSGMARPAFANPAAKPPEVPLSLDALGIVLVPNVLDRTPPFVDGIRPGSPAEQAGVRVDDLIVFINGQLVQSCQALKSEIERMEYDSETRLTLMRGTELLEVLLKSVPGGQ